MAKKSFEPDSGTGEEKKGKSDSAIKIVALAAYLKEKKATWSKDGKQFYVTDKGFEELEK